MKYEAEFRNIIVSSLGMIPMFMLRHIDMIFGCKNQTILNSWGKR
jgi:hypothetical protein